MNERRKYAQNYVGLVALEHKTAAHAGAIASAIQLGGLANGNGLKELHRADRRYLRRTGKTE